MTLLTFIWIYAAMIALSFVESYVEGRNPWDKRKVGWKIKIKNFTFSGYHFFLFFVMLPLLFTLPLITNGWDLNLFGMLISAYFSGLVLEDFMWFVVNPVVKFQEFWTDFTDYYPWIKIRGRKIIPTGYLLGILIAFLSWWFIWK